MIPNNRSGLPLARKIKKADYRSSAGECPIFSIPSNR
jgi:hypothetical protein